MGRQWGGLLLCLFFIFCLGTRAEQAAAVLKSPGQDAVLQWRLPPSANAPIITVAQLTSDGVQPLFFGSTVSANRIKVNEPYEGRLTVHDSLSVDGGIVIFTLKSVSADDAGDYLCIEGLGNEPIIPDCGQMLVIIGQPTDAEVTAVSPPVEGDDLTLTCSATSTSLPPHHSLPFQVRWFDSDGRPLGPNGQEKEKINGSNLIVRSVQRHDLNLKYSCQASDGLQIWSFSSPEYVLVPEYGPKVTDMRLDRSQVEITQGGVLQQDCSAVCNPPCDITWEKEYIEGTWSEKDSSDGLLAVAGVQRSDSGAYQCVATNQHGSAALPFLLIVHYAPNVRSQKINGKNKKKHRFHEGSNITLSCQFDSSPAPTVRWFKGQNEHDPLKVDDLEGQSAMVKKDTFVHHLYTSQFEIANAMCTDTGYYGCSASNRLGSGMDGSLEIDVVCMPRNTHGEKSLRQLYLFPAEQSIFIQFQVEGYPRPDISRIIAEDEKGIRHLLRKGNNWSLNRNVDHSLPCLTTFDLTMPNPSGEYFDRYYYLYIENSEGTKTLAFLLRELGRPKPPNNVTVLLADDTHAVIGWQPGFHGGKPQGFLLEYQDVTETVGNQSTSSWIGVVTPHSESKEEAPLEMTLDGLTAGHTYNVRITANNEFGSRTSAILTFTTLSSAPASASAGTIAGIVVAVIIILVIVILLLLYFFVVRPRRHKEDDVEDVSREPMLTNSDKDKGDTTGLVDDHKPDVSDDKNAVDDDDNKPGDDNEQNDEDDNLEKTPPAENSTNNNTEQDSSAEPLLSTTKEDDITHHDKPRNQEGLIYADLDLPKSKDSTPKPTRKDAVNYETIDFNRQAPPSSPDPDLHIELASDEEELPSKK